jgi:lipoyl(octanoyl) transferase
MVRTVEWVWLGQRSYVEALALQHRIHAAVAEGSAPETLLLLEHPPVITLGRHADPANVLSSAETLARCNIATVQTSRGGDVTYHAPGQLVGYPILRLSGVRKHVSALAHALRSVLDRLGLCAEWRPSQPGLWIGSDKICAFGVEVRRRVTLHGFALNASVELAGFDHIVPCGLPGAGVTSIARLCGCAPPLPALAADVAAACGRAFGVELTEISATSLIPPDGSAAGGDPR